MSRTNLSKHIFFFLMLIVFTTCQSTKTNKNEYTIDVRLTNLTSGEAILAKLDLTTNERVDIDTVRFENGEFMYSGYLDSPYLHTLVINDTSKIHFFLENSEIEIKGDINDLDHIVISGSREDSLFRSYPMDSIFAHKTGMDIMLNYPNYSFTAFTAYYQFQLFNIDLDTMTMIIESFTEPVKQTAYFKHLNSLYKTIKRVSVSQPAPAFSMHNTKGESVHLNDFKGNYLLMDFWASWCAPCRAANPDLVKLYQKHNQRGFTIVGISVDKDREKWLEAVKKDGLVWSNLSEVNGWNDITDLYGVKAVPQNFLLDPDGIIIAKNIETEQLGLLLDSLLSKER